MSLNWIPVIFFFGMFFFNPLLEAVGPQQTTIIICVGLVGIAVVKVVENLTEHKQCHCCKPELDDDEEEDG